VKPPIFIWEGLDLMAFRTAEDAEQFIETLDDDLVVLDSEGRRLRFEIAAKDRRWPGYTLALREEPDPPDEENLRQGLIRALGAPEPEEVPLDALVNEATERFDATQQGFAPSLARVLARAARALRGRRRG
jgi:hypothetical protein